VRLHGALPIATSLRFAHGFFSCTKNILPVLGPIGMLIVAGEDDLGPQGQDMLAKDFHDPTGFRQVTPAAIEDVVVALKADVTGKKHPLASEVQYIDDRIKAVPRDENRLNIETVEGETHGVSRATKG
jgi:hypothetical protein